MVASNEKPIEKEEPVVDSNGLTEEEYRAEQDAHTGDLEVELREVEVKDSKGDLVNLVLFPNGNVGWK